MTRQEFIASVQEDLKRFDKEMAKYQDKGEVPENMKEGDWYEQWLAVIDSNKS